MTQIHTMPFTSSALERPSTLQHIFAQNSYTPRASLEREEGSYFPDSHYTGAESDWNLSQPHKAPWEQMKSYGEEPSPGPQEMLSMKSEPLRNPPREQLPPLRSLFHSATHHTKPLRSPYSDRPSPVFQTALPHGGRPSVSDKPYEGSNFQRPSSSRQYSSDSRSEQGGSIRFQPPPRPTQVGPRSESPRFESHFNPPATTRTQLPQSSSTSTWSSQSQASRPEFFSRDTSSSFRPQKQHRPLPPALGRTEADVAPTYRTSHGPVTPTYPPTPASTVSGDLPVLGKDGLGPKIWTGTQFLPRFVRQADVAGEGMCFFYDDGTHCKTVIDGELVNAHWGVTKAGKPRKRLAIACITCREKKIKCDPDYPRCVQCEKFGRVCKFKNAPRGGQSSPDTPPAEIDEVLVRPGSPHGDGGASFKLEKRHGSSSLSPRQVLRHITPDSDVHQPKRQRTGYSDFTPVASEASPRPSILEATTPRTPWIEPLVTSPSEQEIIQQWHLNPYIANPKLVAELTNIFFTHFQQTSYCMFPVGHTKAWILSSNQKSPDDLMMVYSILALGAIFSPKAEHKPFGLQYASISRCACDRSYLTIQLVQSRLILALYYLAINKRSDAWDMCGAAGRAAFGMKLNLEIESTEDAFLTTFPLGLTRSGYAECRRRTFWSCYLMDRFECFHLGYTSVIQTDDVFLRLPCDTKSFEAQIDVHNPYFTVSALPSQSSNWNVGSMCYLLQIATIWGDIMVNIYRTSQRGTQSGHNDNLKQAYDRDMQRLDDWRSSLPTRFQFSNQNLDTATENGEQGVYLTIHSLYHTSAMNLNRYAHKSATSFGELEARTHIAKQHAEDVLIILNLLARSPNHRQSPIGNFSAQFLGHAIVSAVDIMTAKVMFDNISLCITTLGGSQAILAELAHYWQGARQQQQIVQQRVTQLTDLLNQRSTVGILRSRDVENVYEMQEPLEKIFTRAYDCFYT